MKHRFIRSLNMHVITLCLALLLLPCLAAAANFYVTTNVIDMADGLSWATATNDVQAVLDLAGNGDTIFVSNGTYAITAQLDITNGIAVRSVNGAEVTTIMPSVADSHRVFRLAHADAVVDGFTITKGYAAGTGGQTGGGVRIEGFGTVSNCTITANTVYYNGYGGGVSLINGGRVTNCQITNNTGISWAGAGVYIKDSGIVENCNISGNHAGGNNYGGGVYLLGGGILRNCLVSGNSHGDTIRPTYWPSAGGVHADGGTVENCTIVGNYSISAGGLVCKNNAIVRNSIIYYNTSSAGGSPNYENVGTKWSYENCITTPLVPGRNNSTELPNFADFVANNFRLLPGSPGIDTGTNQLWMADATDLAGTPRIASAIVDRGAYEYTIGALDCSPNGTPTTAVGSNLVVFTAAVTGTNTTGLHYSWDFNNDGTFTVAGNDKAVVTNLYAPGIYSVRLVVQNAIGEIADRTRVDYIKMAPAIAYVSTNSTPAHPYLSWQTAAASVQDAIDAAMDGTTVLVSNGVYEITSQIELKKGITVKSVNGSAVTVITRTGRGEHRIFSISHTDAILDGFTVSNGYLYHNGLGAGIYMDEGTVQNCLITGNELRSSGNGSGVYCSFGGVVKNSQIVGNHLSGSGAGAYLSYGGELRNCLVYANTNRSASAAGVVCSNGGTVESCTIVSNVSTHASGTVGGIVCASGGTVLNSIIYANGASDDTSPNYSNSGSGWSYNNCCTTPAVTGTKNISDDPSFVDPAGDFRITRDSPCINAGSNQLWMEDAFDLADNPRILNHIVDIGAYESEFSLGTLMILR